LKVENIQHLNSQQMHMSVEDCKDVTLKHITIIGPGDIPNTDGIHIARTKDIQVLDCNIKTGDGSSRSRWEPKTCMLQKLIAARVMESVSEA
jgi:polygalacturonase